MGMVPDLIFFFFNMSMHQPATKWNVCIRVPYGTSYALASGGWQCPKNGCFKMALTRIQASKG
jgi:hypothetical protein